MGQTAQLDGQGQGGALSIRRIIRSTDRSCVKELRKLIAGGLDWLSIRSLPASKGAVPWFWHWGDRRYAVWWDSEGLPFVQGPNLQIHYGQYRREQLFEAARR